MPEVRRLLVVGADVVSRRRPPGLDKIAQETSGVAPTRPSQESAQVIMERQVGHWIDYFHMQRSNIDLHRVRQHENLRRRADGSPSASPPAAQLSYMAEVQDVPDGGKGNHVKSRLADYFARLRLWKMKGLYDGPTTPHIVNKEDKHE